jgi:hypothetical protein
VTGLTGGGKSGLSRLDFALQRLFVNDLSEAIQGIASLLFAIANDTAGRRVIDRIRNFLNYAIELGQQLLTQLGSIQLRQRLRHDSRS